MSKHPTPEQLEPLLKAVDVACWTMAVKVKTRPGDKVRVDWKGAQQELAEAWGMFRLATGSVLARKEEERAASSI